MGKLDIITLMESMLNGNYSIHTVADSGYVIVTDRGTNEVLKCIRIEDSVEAHIDQPINIFINIQSNLKIDISKIGICGHPAIVAAGFENDNKAHFFPSVTRLKYSSDIGMDNGHTITISPSDATPFYNSFGLNTILGSVIEKDNMGKPILGIVLHANTDYLNQITCDYGTNYEDDYEKIYTEFGIIAESKWDSDDIHFVPTK